MELRRTRSGPAMAPEDTSKPFRAIVDEIDALLKSRKTAEADEMCRQLVAQQPQKIEVWLLSARAAQQNQNFDQMLAHVTRALSINNKNITARLMKAEALMHLGRMRDALAGISKLESTAKDHPVLLQQIAGFYTQAGRHEAAARYYRQAVALTPHDPQALYNLASAQIALGEMDEADQLLSRVIELNPQDYDAYYNRSTLRTQTSESNHVTELSTALATEVKHRGGDVPIFYALAKELEDLQEYGRAFEYLKRGSDKRRQGLSYLVEDDVATMAALENTFQPDLFESPQSTCDAAPIFIVGLPRSGTTLVDRILSSHSAVESLGEVNDFVMSLMTLLGGTGSKWDLIQKSAHIDFNALGNAYTKSTQGYGHKAVHLIDKTPVNFLYLGLIALALPQAKIIHLRRHPMDSCYAMYKTLFRMAYPFSYDLNDLGHYYIAYDKLMKHWRRVLPERIFDVAYEDLVQNQEEISRQLVAACDLGWEEACLAFHENRSAAATASAAQVRQPIYKTSVQKWRHYEVELKPLQKILVDGGVMAE